MMSASSQEQTLASLLPALPGSWQLLRACQDPERQARSALRSLLGPNAQCAFCREHRIDASSSLEDYRQRVPIRDHQALGPWLERSCAGQPGVLTTDPVLRTTRTSGTTATAKTLPLTRGLERAFASAQQLWIDAVMRQTPTTTTGTFYVLATTGPPAHPPSGPETLGSVGTLAAGSSTALGLVRSGSLQGRLQIPPPTLSQMDDYELRMYLTLLDALGRDLSALVAVSPSTLVLLFERLDRWAEALAYDLRRGSITWQGAALPAAALPAHSAQPERSAQLAEQLRRHGVLRPRGAWPALALLCCWTAGPSARYRPYLDELSGNLPVHDPGYAASEGWFAPALVCGSPAALPLASHYLFEWLEPDATSCDPTVAWADLEIGRRYRLVVTTPAGLFRYDTEDLVEVTGKLGALPLISFCRRAGAVVSVVGEKLTETQLVEAVRRAEKRLDLVVRDFVAEAVFATQPPAYYRLRVALVQPAGAPRQPRAEALAAAIDEALSEVNIEYQHKRNTGRLGAARIELLGIEAFVAERGDRAAAGAPDAQLKTLHLRLEVAIE